MRHNMELCDQNGEDQDKIWRRWTEATVKSEQGQDRWIKEVM
jgi:hypothetical protein